MKSIKKITTVILFLFISIFFFSCSKELSRDTAKDLIIQKYNLPQTETVKIVKNYYKSQYGDRGAFGMEKIAIVSSPYYSEFRKMLDGLKSKGLIAVNETKEYTGGIHYTWATISLTDEGEKISCKGKQRTV